MHKTYVRLVTLVLSLLTLSAASLGQIHSISTKSAQGLESYPWLTYLTQGSTQWIKIPEGEDRKEGEVAGSAYRVLITTSEIYNSLIFERIELGPEGCCAKVAWSRKLDMQGFCASFKVEGECSGLKFTKWLSPVSFEFRLKDMEYQVLDVSKEAVQIKRL